MRALAALALVATVAFPGGAAAAQPPVPRACVTILVSAPTATGTAGQPGFSARQVEDLTLSVLFPADLTHGLLLALDLFTPKGFLYQTLTVPVAAPGTTPATRVVEDYPRPVQELAPRRTSVGGASFLRVDVPFPVGGTLIATGSLYGVWHVAPRLDGALNPCAPPTGFTIRP